MRHRLPLTRALRAAFSLLEVLVSISILLVMMIVLTSVFDLFTRSYRGTTGSMQTYDDVRSIITLMGRDISAAMVRTDTNRWLNYRVDEGEDVVAIYFAAPDEKIESTTNMSFISHYSYFWVKEDAAIYRAIQNSHLDPSDLLETASHPQNQNEAANRARLQRMTLAYSSGSPYGWISSPKMRAAMNEATALPMLRNVFSFEVLSHRQPPSESGSPERTWSDSSSLPYFVEIRMGVADERNARILEQDPERTDLLKTFMITVPMVNRGINSNQLY